MPKIRVYANYEFTNDSDNCNNDIDRIYVT